MFFGGQSLFEAKRPQIPDDAKVVFISDLFVEDYVGGAELTSQALISSSPYKVFKLHSRDVTPELINQGIDKHWIFGNYCQMNGQLIPEIVGKLNYSVLEYDYKFCKYRSQEKHKLSENVECDCSEQPNGKMISAFYYGATALWWMSEGQMKIFHDKFPFLKEKQNTVLSSVFEENFFAVTKLLREKYKDTPRKNWIVLGSNSWIKGLPQAEQWCKNNNKQYEIVWNVPHEQLLDKLAQAEGFVYLPQGNDTCPRMVIEAKLLGCELYLNNFVQHASEEWFATKNVVEIEEYLYSARKTFWSATKNIIEKVPTISGYTTTYNCISQRYPFEQSIRSMLMFCDEVIVVDGGSSDGTWETLKDMAETFAHLQVHSNPRDWNHPRFAVFDGEQKAFARSLCTKDFCWQMDSDEIVHEEDTSRIIDLTKKFPKGANILALPVVEYWGGYQKVRIDVNPWKWRLSKNLPEITHGIPVQLRVVDSNGQTYAQQGTDGCDMISKITGEMLPFVSFYLPEVHSARMEACRGNPAALNAYHEWMNNIVTNVPGVYHFSWFDLERKIKTYKGYWGKHWKSLFDIEVKDTAENNMMFDVPWSEVTDEMIHDLAIRLAKDSGGWVWHQKWDGRQTPHIIVRHSPPQLAKEFYKE